MDAWAAIRAVASDAGTTDLFNQVSNEALAGKEIGLSLRGTSGDEPFLLDFIPFRVPNSARVFNDEQFQAEQAASSEGFGGRRMLEHAETFSRILTESDEEDIFDAQSGFDQINPWIRNSSLYKESEVLLTDVELLKVDTLNSSFNTFWKNSGKTVPTKRSERRRMNRGPSRSPSARAVPNSVPARPLSLRSRAPSLTRFPSRAQTSPSTCTPRR